MEASINKSSRHGHKNKNFTRDYPLAIHVLFGFNQGFNIRQKLFFNSSKEMISYRHQKNNTFGFLCLNLVPVVGVILDFPSTRKTDIQASFQLSLLSNGLVDPDKNKCKIFPPTKSYDKFVQCFKHTYSIDSNITNRDKTCMTSCFHRGQVNFIFKFLFGKWT